LRSDHARRHRLTKIGKGLSQFTPTCDNIIHRLYERRSLFRRARRFTFHVIKHTLHAVSCSPANVLGKVFHGLPRLRCFTLELPCQRLEFWLRSGNGTAWSSGCCLYCFDNFFTSTWDRCFGRCFS